MVNYSNSFLEFLRTSDSRIAKILWRIHSWNGYYKSHEGLLTTNEIDYITFRKDGTISYLPAGKEHKYNEETNEWSREGRQQGKPGKVIRKLFTPKLLKLIPDKEFEIFSNKYKANYACEGYDFALLGNKKIPHVYDMERERGGTLGDSCMNNDTDYFDIYKYCEKLKILILKNKDGKLAGRSLIWNISDDFTLMDRIYVSKDHLYDLFLEYAEKQKWYRKKHYKTYDYKREFVSPDGVHVSKDIKIETPTDHDYFPYIDTMSYGGDGYLSNYSGEYTYNNTDGSRDGDPNSEPEEDDHEGEIYDDFREEYINEDDAVYIERGERRNRDRYSHVDDAVRIGDYWYREDDDNVVEIDGEYYDKNSDDVRCIDGEWHKADDCVYSEFHEEDLLEADCVYSKPMKDYIKEDEAVEVDGDWYHEDHDDIVKIGDDYYLKEGDDVVEIDDEYYLKDDEKIVEIKNEWYLKSNTDLVKIKGKWYRKDDDLLIKKGNRYYLKQLELALQII